MTPLMSNISIILSNQFSLTGITSPGEAITSVLYSTDLTPIRSGLKGWASILVHVSMVIPIVLGRLHVHFLAGSSLSCIFGNFQNVC